MSDPGNPTRDALDARAIERLAAELDATPEQIQEAIDAVGPRPADIEMHLKGTRSTTNSDRVRDAGG